MAKGVASKGALGTGSSSGSGGGWVDPTALLSRGFLPSPAAVLFFGGGVAKGEAGRAVEAENAGGDNGKAERARNAGGVSMAMDEEAVGVSAGGGEAGGEVVMSAARKERMRKTARARRAEAAPDALWTEVREMRVCNLFSGLWGGGGEGEHVVVRVVFHSPHYFYDYCCCCRTIWAYSGTFWLLER